MRQFDQMPKQHYKPWDVCPYHLRIDLDKRFVTIIPNSRPTKKISGHWTGMEIKEQYHLTDSAICHILKIGLFNVSLTYKGKRYYLISEVEKKMKGRKYERNDGSV